MSTPVTVSISRHVNLDQTGQALVWLRPVAELAEGRFGEPSSVDVQVLRTPLAAPPRWKQMCAIFLGFFAFGLGVTWAAMQWFGDVSPTAPRPV